MPASVWRGYITFGLVTIPVKLYKAARAERVKLREVYEVSPQTEPEPEPVSDTPHFEQPAATALVHAVADQDRNESTTLAPVRRMAVEDTGDVLPSAKVGKGYEFEKGRFVSLGRGELKALAPKTSIEMELLEFVTLASVDPIYFETSYYVQPEPAGEKPYALLYESLKETGLAGVARIAMHRREHVVIVRTGVRGLIATTMYFTSEVRSQQEYKADPALVNPKELELANTLIRALTADFAPEKYRDTYREQLEKLIEAKVAGQPAAPPSPATSHEPAADIMEALRKSLAGLKKPAASVPEPRQVHRTAKRKTG